MEFCIKQWKLHMILNIYTVYYLVAIVIISSHVLGEEGEVSESLNLIFTANSTYIEIEREYDNYTVTEVTCDQSPQARILRTFTCDDLEPCTDYWIRAKFKLLDNTTSTGVYHATTTYEEPAIAINYALSFSNSIFLSWNSTHKNCIKEIKIETVGDDGSRQISRYGGGEDATIDNLLPCQQYHLTLTATDVNGNVLGNETEHQNTTYVVPGPVQSIEYTVTENEMLVTWDAPEHVTCIEIYYVYLTTTNCLEINPDECNWINYNVSRNQRQLLIPNLEGCQNYTLKISVNGDNINSSSIVEFSTDVLVPGPIINLSVNTSFSTNLTIIWDPPTENYICVDHYSVIISDDDEIYNTTDRFFTFTNLLPCGKYEIQVAAVSFDDIEGEWVNQYVTMDYDSPSSIRDDRVTTHSTQVTVRWEPPSFANLCVSHYRIAVWYYEGSKENHILDANRTTTWVVIDNLVSCMDYKVQIIAVTSSSNAIEGPPTILDATTSPRRVEATKNIDTRPARTSIWIMSSNSDESNNCEVLYFRYKCENLTLAEIPYGEVTLPFSQGPHMPITGIVEPLSPGTQYLCTVQICNYAGWSGGSSFKVDTESYYPGQPEQVIATPISPTSFNIRWRPPMFRNGNLALYRLHVQMIGPQYEIPEFCGSLRPQELTQPIQATDTTFNFDSAMPYFQYSVQIAAINDFGVGDFTAPVTVVTKPARSNVVTNFDVKLIQGPNLAEVYKANVTLTWPLPCYTNGKVIGFEGAFSGSRENFPPVHFNWSMSTDNLKFAKADRFEWFEDDLRPEYNYTVTITVLVEGAGPSPTANLNFISPAGIPPKPNISYNADVDVFSAPNPTESAFVRFSTDILNPDMGEILYVALLVSQKDCQQDPSPQMALIDSEKNWPDVPTWGDVQHDTCIKQYQTTPEHWSPTKSNTYDPKGRRIVQYIIGEENCSKRANANVHTYCNGPLKPGVEYALVVRLFTSRGYSDANCMYFRTDSKVEIQFVLLMIISCLLMAFFLGFVYLWITKKIVWHGEPFVSGDEHTGDITSKNFLEHYDEIVRNDKLSREFKELMAISNELNLSNVASTSNETKNRYSNISPYDKNRVILDCDSDGADYINASFINGYKRRKEYIATQGPKPETFVDFWRMIIQYNVRLIVMVTQFREGESMKCHQYFPYINKEMRVGHNITITCKKETHYENYVRRELLVEHFSDCISRTVVHYLFRKWPDHDCPDDVTHLIDFVRKVKSDKIPRHSPIVVHCSAGVGRTGTFIGLDIVMQRLKSENRISIYDTVKQLRFQRMKMVQTIQQYQFLYKCAYHLVKKKSSVSSKNGIRKKDEAIECVENSDDTIANGHSNGNGLANGTRNGKALSRVESIM